MKIVINPNEKDFVQIVGDGMISAPHVGEGRMIPVMILDCQTRPDLYDLIMLHQDQPAGDVTSTWIKSLFSSDFVYLKLEFERPTPALAIIEFNLKKNAILVDGIVQSNSAYIQPNNHGSKVSEGFNRGSVLIEIPSEELPFDWEKLYSKQLKKKFKASGLNGSAALKAAHSAIKASRALWNIRRNNPLDAP